LIRPARPATLGASVALFALVATGCAAGGVHSLSFAPPPATTVAPPAPPDTLPAGLAATVEAPVGGVTTTTAPAIGRGRAAINGTVTGPNGPLAGAAVEIDRVVGSSYASARTTTAADGTWSFRNILGGDYRVRAWQAPALDMATPQTVFLASDQPQSVDLQLTSYQAQQVQVAINPADPVQGQPSNLVIQVTNPRIDADGVLTLPPVAGVAVTLVNGSGWQVNNGNPLPTDADGQVTFQVECTTTGDDPLSAQVASNPPVSLLMPACAAPTPTTTTVPGNQFGSTTTTTTCTTTPGATDTTTTTLVFGGC
jgi:hypothetical protein